MEWPRRILASDSFLALDMGEPARRCRGIHPIPYEKVVLEAEDVLERHKKSRIYMIECCSCK